MKLIKVLLFLLMPLLGFSQIEGEAEVYLKGDLIEAQFNGGGIEEFTKFIRKEFDYSKVTKAGKMVGAFTIDVDGNVKNIKIIEFFDKESATEFIRVLKLCPKWQPAKRGGKPISIEIKYPMVFNVQEKKPLTVVPVTDDDASGDNKIYNTAGIEFKPEFPGGTAEFYKYISRNYNTPSDKNFKGGKVMVSFVVEKDGTVTEIKVLRDCGFGTGEEAKRVLQNCPKWKPAMQNDKPVRCLYMIPIVLTGN